MKLFASLRGFGPDRQELELPAGTTIEAVVRTVGIPPTIRLLRIVNGEHRPGDYLLRDGDELALFPPIAGGQARLSAADGTGRDREQDPLPTAGPIASQEQIPVDRPAVDGDPCALPDGG